jgi:ribose-phosphate pyrophosphokinase
MINSCGFKRVTVYDPHSDVTAALIDNIYVVGRLELVRKNLSCIGHCITQTPRTIIISPDAGAMKTNQKIAQYFGLPHIVATKVRNIKTGEITATQIHTDTSLEDKDLLILDDICDGGRTFIELAKVLNKHNPKSIHLYTTVSISQKGRDAVAPFFNSVTFNHKLGE